MIHQNKPIGFDPTAHRAVNNGEITAKAFDIDTTKTYLVRYDHGSKVATGCSYKGMFTDILGEYGKKGKQYLNFYSIEKGAILLDWDDARNAYVTDDQNIIEPSIDWITYIFLCSILEDVIREQKALSHMYKCLWIKRKSGGRFYAHSWESTPIGDKEGKIVMSYSLKEDKEGSRNLRGSGKVEISGTPLATLTIGQQRTFLQYLLRREHKVTRIDTKARVFGNTPTPYEIWEQIDHELHDRPKQISRFTGVELRTSKGYSTLYAGSRQNVLLRSYNAYPVHGIDAIDWEVEWHNHKTKDREYNYANDLFLELANTESVEEFSQLILTKVFGVCNFYNATGETDGHLQRYPIREWQLSLRIQAKCKEFVRYRPTKRLDIHKRTAQWFPVFGKTLVALGLYAQGIAGTELMTDMVEKRHTRKSILATIKKSLDPYINGILDNGIEELCSDFKNKHFKLLDAELELLRSQGIEPTLYAV